MYVYIHVCMYVSMSEGYLEDGALRPVYACLTVYMATTSPDEAFSFACREQKEELPMMPYRTTVTLPAWPPVRSGCTWSHSRWLEPTKSAASTIPLEIVVASLVMYVCREGQSQKAVLVGSTIAIA